MHASDLEYGDCGVGAYCLGGCDPLHSNSLDSCVPAPTCKTQDYKLNTLDGITSNTKYLGDASKSNWVASGTPLIQDNGGPLVLNMNETNGGTLLASASYVWYGKVSAKLRTSRGKGVVTAFILLSDVKDEIDFEFVGADLLNAQSNYYFQGITNYDQGKNLSISDTYNNEHTYEIDWTPEKITWSIDGKQLRSQTKAETWNATSNQYHYPQTPARIQLSLWPAGGASNAKGTVDWAGGQIDWNSQDMQKYHYYYALVSDVNVQCYNPPSGANVSGKTSYVYTGPAGTNDTVSTTDKQTVLKSFLGTGTNMSAELPSPVSSTKPSGTSSTSAAATSSEIAVIPGLSGAGTGSNGLRGGSGNAGTGGAGSGSGNLGSDGGISSAPASTASTIGGFSQGNTAENTQGKSGAPVKNERVLQGSLFAGLVAVVGLLAL
ncbi:MAG: hypothetical protein M1836_006771 [Candelina mexicana]|nr:MAG: hypothetical protein M1836_006771 [Candelina mexicana]